MMVFFLRNIFNHLFAIIGEFASGKKLLIFLWILNFKRMLKQYN